MKMIARGLGKTIEKVIVKFEVAKALKDVTHLFGGR
jgi:2,4-diaminopentanoate dehydrogenase